MDNDKPKVKLSDRERERRLGADYAQLLKDTPQNAAVHKDCQQVITASLELMHSYNKIAVFMQNKVPFVPKKTNHSVDPGMKR